MAEFKVNSAQLTSTATTINGKLEEFRSLTDNISNALSSLGSAWSGEAYNAFMEKFNEMQPSFSSYAEVISSYVTFLNQTAEQYEQAEQAAQTTTDNIEVNLFR